jgi:hypothetical protein
MPDFDEWFDYVSNVEHITQGSIVDGQLIEGLESQYYAVLSPECDLEQRKSEFVVMVAEGDKTAAIKEILSSHNLTDDNWKGLKPHSQKRDKVRARVLEQINGKIGARWFYVPPSSASGLIVFDFQKLHSVSAEKIPALCEARIAVLRSPFKESLVTRLYSYLTRVGTADEYKKPLAELVLNATGLIFPPENKEGTGSPPSENSRPHTEGQ